MKLQALKDFKHAVDTINVVHRFKGDKFDLEDSPKNPGHIDRLIEAKLVKKVLTREKKVIEPEETK